MLIDMQNATVANMPQTVPSIGRIAHFGIKLYKDDEVPFVKMEDTRQKWNILVFLSEVYAPDMRVKDSGVYIAPVFDFNDGIWFGDSFKGYLLSIPFDAWKLLDIYNLDLLFGSSSFIPYVILNKKEINLLGLMMDILGCAIESDESLSNEKEVIYLCRALMATISRYYLSQEQSEQSSTGNLLVDRFLELIMKNGIQEKNLDFYAKELKVKPKYLSHIVALVTGKYANRWIAEYVINEAKLMLLSSVCSIQSVAEKAGFRTNAEFSRYFKRHTGMTPIQFRKQGRAASCSSSGRMPSQVPFAPQTKMCSINYADRR